MAYLLNDGGNPWFDYGYILLHGMCARLERSNGCLQLERTGPFVPPISFPGINQLVVTKEVKQQLMSSGLSGLIFRPVIKKHIVELDWQNWDKSVDEPKEYPKSGEPEGYILENAHSEELSEQMGELWELDPHVAKDFDTTPDFYRQMEMGKVCVSEKAKAFFTAAANLKDWIRLVPI